MYGSSLTSAAMAERIHQIEACAARAWPAAVDEVLDGWHVRFTHGITRRANSVLPNEACGQYDLNAKLARVEEFYSRYGLPTRYQISPAARPEDLDRILGERGYQADARTCVQVASIVDLTGRATHKGYERISVGGDPADEWIETYLRLEGTEGIAAEVQRGIFGRIAARKGFALLAAAGRSRATTLVVVESDWAGIFCVAVDPELRRRGAATAVIGAAAEWACARGARHAYLQVMEHNLPARALYAQLGFATLYHYHYREAPARPRLPVESSGESHARPCDN